LCSRLASKGALVVNRLPKFNQALAIELAATLANATSDRLVTISEMSEMITKSRTMIDESRELLVRAEQVLSRTNSKVHTPRTEAIAKAAECERFAREAPTDEIRVTMWETRQLWIDIAYFAKDA
jgi:hypothetical protein